MACLVENGFAQRHEYGIFAGGSYYLGELNASKHINEVSNLSFGVMYQKNINTRYTLRYSLLYGELMGSDEFFDIGLNNFRDLAFDTKLYEFGFMIMFNFFPYGLNQKELPYTPYIGAGLSIFNVNANVYSLQRDSLAAIPPENYEYGSHTALAFPFGFGFKFLPVPALDIGIEWMMRKTSSDRIDGLENQYVEGNTSFINVPYHHPEGFQKGNLKNRDWYSTIGITILFRPGAGVNKCPTPATK